VERIADPGRPRRHTARGRLRHRLGQLLVVGEPVTELQSAALDRAVQLIAGCAEPGPDPAAPVDGSFPEAAAMLCSVSRRWTTLTSTIACLRRYWEELRTTRSGARGETAFERSMSELTLELCRAVADAEAGDRTELQLVTEEEHDLVSSLIRGSTGDPRLLGWLAYTQMRAACLGLWSAHEVDPEAGRSALDIVGSYTRESARLGLPARTPVEQFPPEQLIDDTAWGPDELIVVLPTMTTTTDLGLLAMVTRAQATEVGGGDRLFDKGALLGISVEREVMTERLQRSTADLATFSHEMADGLRNPIASILMWTSAARSRAGNSQECEPVLRVMDQITQAALDAPDKVSALVRYVEMVQGAAPPVPVDLNRALGRALATLGAIIAEHGAVVETGDLPTVPGNFGELELVLRNLIENALHHSEAETPRVRLDAARNGSSWTVRCHDNGRGSPAELQGRIFEPFARAETTAPGSRLGLATCRRIIQGLGGRIWVEASGPEGTTIALSLPAVFRRGPVGLARRPMSSREHRDEGAVQG